MVKPATLYEQFSLGERNPPGAGLMYFMRYSEERIEAHRNQVVLALKSMEISFKSAGSSGAILVVGPSRNLSPSYNSRLEALLEELSILNKADEYYSEGLEKYKDLSKLKEKIVLVYNNLIAHHKKEEAYSYVKREVPEFTRLFRAADENNCLYKRERVALDEIERFCRGQTKLLEKDLVLA